jgi:hypothetical protein
MAFGKGAFTYAHRRILTSKNFSGFLSFLRSVRAVIVYAPPSVGSSKEYPNATRHKKSLSGRY